MSATTQALLTVFGILGYLAIGWVSTIVFVAMYPHTDSKHSKVPQAIWWWNLFVWPLFLFGAGVVWVCLHGSEHVMKFTLNQAKRINPAIKGDKWY